MSGLQNAALHATEIQRADMTVIEVVFSTYWELNFHRKYKYINIYFIAVIELSIH